MKTFKNNYSISDKVTTPLGSGIILSIDDLGYCKIKHETYKDEEGDTFCFSTFDLIHCD